MSMPLPANVAYCKLSGRWIRAVADTTDDTDRDPDARTIDGLKVKITASVPYVRNANAVADGSPIIHLDPIELQFDAQGYVIDSSGQRGIYLVASDDPDLNPTGWTYRATVSSTTLAGYYFDFEAPSGGTLQIGDLVRVPTNPGTELPAWSAAVASTQSNVTAAQTARTGAETARTGAETALGSLTAQKGAANGIAPLDGNSKLLETNIPTRLSDASLAAAYVSDDELATILSTQLANYVTSTVLTASLAVKADLVGGKVPNAQLPALAITDTFAVSSQSAMLALDAQRGDIALRSDANTTYILAADDPTVLGNWKQILVPASSVLSVAGKTGVVNLVKADVGLGLVDNTSDATKPISTATQTALDTKAPLVASTRRRRLTGTVSVSASTTQSFALTGLDYGSGVGLTDSGDGIAVATAGLYFCAAEAFFSSGSVAGPRVLLIRVNGATVREGGAYGSGASGQPGEARASMAATLPLNANDVVSLAAYNGTTATVVISGVNNKDTGLTVTRIGTSA